MTLVPGARIFAFSGYDCPVYFERVPAEVMSVFEGGATVNIGSRFTATLLWQEGDRYELISQPTWLYRDAAQHALVEMILGQTQWLAINGPDDAIEAVASAFRCYDDTGTVEDWESYIEDKEPRLSAEETEKALDLGSIIGQALCANDLLVKEFYNHLLKVEVASELDSPSARRLEDIIERYEALGCELTVHEIQ